MPEETSTSKNTNQGGLDSTTKFLIILAVICGGGYFVYEKILKAPAQAVGNAATSVAGTAKDAAGQAKEAADKATDILGGLLKGAQNTDPKVTLRKANDFAGTISSGAGDLAHGLIGLTLDEEWAHGDRIRRQIQSKLQSSGDVAAQERINRLAQPILAYVKRTKGRTYTFTIIEDPTMNAFAILGGNVFIFRGLLDEMQNDVVIQSVIAHEIAHVELGHCVKGSMAAIRAAEVGGNLAGTIAGKVQQFITLGYSEAQEFESDKFAYMSQRAMGVPKQDRLRFAQMLEAYADKKGMHDDLDSKADNMGEAISKEVKRHYRSHPPGGSGSAV